MNDFQFFELPSLFAGDAQWLVADDGSIDRRYMPTDTPIDTRETITPYTQAEYTTTADGEYEYLKPLQSPESSRYTCEILPTTHKLFGKELPVAKDALPVLRSTGKEFNGILNITTDAYCRSQIELDTLTTAVINAVDRVGASRRKHRIVRGDSRRPRQTSRGSMAGGLQSEEVLGTAWLIANEYPELEVDAIVKMAIHKSIKQGRQIASGEIPVSGIHPISGKPITFLHATGYYQDTTDRLLELAYTVTSELDKTYRTVDGITVTLGSLLKQGYNQTQCASKLGIDGRSVRKRIASARKQYNALFEATDV